MADRDAEAAVQESSRGSSDEGRGSSPRAGVSVLYRSTFDPDASSAQRARIAIDDALRNAGYDEPARSDVMLVASELCANAVEASPAQPFEVAVEVDADAICVGVTNHEAREVPPPSTWRPVDVLAGRGRGLMIVAQIARDVEVDRRGRTNVIRAVIDAPS